MGMVKEALIEGAEELYPGDEEAQDRIIGLQDEELVDACLAYVLLKRRAAPWPTPGM
jgi:hypothetical protein